MNEQQNYTVSPSEKTMPPQKSKKKIVIPIVILGFIIIVSFLFGFMFLCFCQIIPQSNQ